MPLAAAYVDSDGTILSSNAAFDALCADSTGKTSSGARALPVLFIPEDRERVLAILAASGGRVRRTSRSTTMLGTLARVAAEFVPIRRKSAAGFVWLVTLSPTQKASETTSVLAVKAALTAGIVHDLRAPVQVVLGWASLLRRKRDDPERIEQALSIIERNAEQLMKLLEDLLEQTRPAWTRTPVRRGEVDLAGLLSAEIRAVQPLADEAGVGLTLILDSPGIAVEGDEVQLRRVLANLLGNALKFTPRGGAIEIRLWHSESSAGIVVRDTGQGIDRELLPKVFEPYWQEPGDAAGRKGLGLGLHVVRQLVELHGGTVSVASEGSGRGTTFTVVLPAGQNGTEAEHPEPAARPAPPTPFDDTQSLQKVQYH